MLPEAILAAVINPKNMGTRHGQKEEVVRTNAEVRQLYRLREINDKAHRVFCSGLHHTPGPTVLGSCFQVNMSIVFSGSKNSGLVSGTLINLAFQFATLIAGPLILLGNDQRGLDIRPGSGEVHVADGDVEGVIQSAPSDVTGIKVLGIERDTHDAPCPPRHPRDRWDSNRAAH